MYIKNFNVRIYLTHPNLMFKCKKLQATLKVTAVKIEITTTVTISQKHQK